MNALSPRPPRPAAEIEIVYDLVCPWCYLGTRRLMRALQQRSGPGFNLVWRPFLLNPDMPRGGMPRLDYVIRKFGGEERARRLYASIRGIGHAEGVTFNFERIRRTPSSLDAHRLVRWAARAGRATAMAEALFAAYFTDGRNIGDIDVLAAIAGEIGLDATGIRRFLLRDDEAGAVHAENLRAHRLGINGVPCFVIGGRHAIAGAQDEQVLTRLLDVAAAEMASDPDLPPG